MGLATLKCHKIPIFLISRCHALWPPRASMLPRSAWTGGLSMISWGFTWDFQQQFHGDLHGIFNSNFMWFTWDFQQQFHGKFMGLTLTIADSTSRHWDFSMGFQPTNMEIQWDSQHQTWDSKGSDFVPEQSIKGIFKISMRHLRIYSHKHKSNFHALLKASTLLWVCLKMG